MCDHGQKKWRYANNKGVKQIAAYCTLCDAFLHWGSKVAGVKKPLLAPTLFGKLEPSKAFELDDQHMRRDWGDF